MMGRLFLVLIVLMALIALAISLGRVAHAMTHLAVTSTEDVRLPKTLKTMSYVLLIVLMFGVITGWLGGL